MVLGKWTLPRTNPFPLEIWNEKWCNLDYITTLRQELDHHNLSLVKIIACDAKWDEFDSIWNNRALRDAISAYGSV